MPPLDRPAGVKVVALARVRPGLSRAFGRLIGAAVALVALAGCAPTVKVEAPDKPIEINVNIRVEHEVRVKIDRELDQVFSRNPELFGLPEEKKP